MVSELTFERVLEVFDDYLAEDTCFEVVKTSRGYALIEWNPVSEDWIDISACPTPEQMKEQLLKCLREYHEYNALTKRGRFTKADRDEIKLLLQKYITRLE